MSRRGPYNRSAPKRPRAPEPEKPQYTDRGGYSPDADPCPVCGVAPHKPDCRVLLRYLKKPAAPLRKRFPKPED